MLSRFLAHGVVEECKIQCKGDSSSPIEYVVNERPGAGAPLPPTHHYRKCDRGVAGWTLDEQSGTLFDEADHLAARDVDRLATVPHRPRRHAVNAAEQVPADSR